jgi:hypothetical protein
MKHPTRNIEIISHIYIEQQSVHDNISLNIIRTYLCRRITWKWNGSMAIEVMTVVIISSTQNTV